MLLNDGVRHHPKILTAGAEAAWLWAAAIDYCRENLTDGHLPTSALKTLGNFATRPDRLAERCVAAGLLEPTEGGWRIHDFLAYNDSKAAVDQKRREAAIRKARHRAAQQGVTQESRNGPVDVPLGHERDTGVPRAGAYPHFGVGVGTGSGLDPGEEPEKGAGADWSEGVAWDLWRAIAGAHHAKCPVIAGPGNYQHLRTLAGTYTRAEVEAALRAWWDSPHTGGRNLGLFVAQMPELLEHLARADGRVFRDRRPVLAIAPPEPSYAEQADAQAARLLKKFQAAEGGGAS